MSSWVDEQIRARIQSDEDSFSNAFNDVSEAISGRRIFDEIRENDIVNASNAIEEIARYYDIPEDFLKKHEVREGESLSERLEDIFGQFGIMRREVELRDSWYKDAAGVYLGTTKEGRYVALMPSKNGYVYKDYMTGKRIRVNHETQANLSSKGICFYKPMPSCKLGVRDLISYVVKSLSVSDVVYIALITLFVTLFSMVTPFLTQIIYSQSIYSSDISGLAAIFVFMVFTGISVTLLQITRTLLLSRIEIKADVSINAALMMRFMTLPATFFKKFSSGELAQRAFAKWAGLYKKEAKLIYNPPLFLKLTPVVQPAITLIGTFILYWKAFNAHVTPEDYMAFMSSYGLLSGAFIAFCGITLSIASIAPMIDMIKPILEAVPEISHGKILSRVRGGIEINNVSFRYSEKAPMILDKLSLRIRPGEYVAIVGKSGCGKSTLMRLLLGFERPDRGVIYYDGSDIKTLDLRHLRNNIGSVMQNSGLFPGSIYSNITISAPQLTEKAAWEAAEMAGVADDIRKMPMKMQTMISEGAGTISGGQRQRIIIARAIASKPKILLFDEATSALDNITQKIVSDSLDKLKCTRIVIAHRLSTVRHCGRILVLDDGHIAEEGNYQELIDKKGLFASLVERQKLGEVISSIMEIFRTALRSLLSNRTRSILTMLGIIIGVGAVITMVAKGTCFSDADVRSGAKVCVIGNTVAKELFGYTNPNTNNSCRYR